MRSWIAYVGIAIFIVAFGLRWPSCGESFWLDELHTAWVVDASWADVGPRAAIGNQQPIYFYSLWIWRQLTPESWIAFYGVEGWLRLTSVLLTSVSAGLLSWLVYRGSGSIVGGAFAGIGLAVESSAIFFGTELRPYAAIVLLSTCALGLALIPKDRLRGRDRWLLHGVVMLAALTQVTSLVTLGWLLAWVIALDWFGNSGTSDRMRTFLHRHWMLGIWIAGSIVWLVGHASLWQNRFSWQSFANANSLVQLWQLWPWMPVILVPGFFWIVSRLCRGKLAVSPDVLNLSMLAFVLSVSAIGCFFLSYFGGVPLWHRRYLIAGLPFLCALFGYLLGCVRLCHRPVRRELTIAALGLVCLWLLTSQQGTFNRLMRGQMQLTHRSEDWRAATRYITKHKSAGDQVWVDAGLIEQSRYPTFVEDASREAYFRYPVSGPYRIETAVGLGREGLSAWLSRGDTKYLIRRGTASSLSPRPIGVDVRAFGGVTVLIRKPTY